MVDTGAPAVFVNGDAVVPVGDLARPALHVGGAILHGAPTLRRPFGFGANLPVVLGAPALLGAAHTFDFRASVWTLGGAAPADTEEAGPSSLPPGGRRRPRFPPNPSVRLQICGSSSPRASRATVAPPGRHGGRVNRAAAGRRSTRSRPTGARR